MEYDAVLMDDSREGDNILNTDGQTKKFIWYMHEISSTVTFLLRFAGLGMLVIFN